jgi:hypothetical protein
MPQNFHEAVTKWDECCSALGPWEAHHLTSDDIRLALGLHFSLVNDLLSRGRLLQQQSKQSEFPDKALAAHVEARIRHLEDKLALWHREMAPAEQQRILAAAFK